MGMWNSANIDVVSMILHRKALATVLTPLARSGEGVGSFTEEAKIMLHDWYL
jgi:hypothetical protein